MKIVYFNPTGVVGGAEMCLLDVLASLRTARPDWSLRVLLGDDGPLRPAVEALGVDCEVQPLPDRLASLGDAGLALGSRGKLTLLARAPAAALAAGSYFRKLRRWFQAAQPDLVQTNGMKAHILGTWAAPRGVPVVWHLHDYIRSRPVMVQLLRRTARPGVWGVAVSRSIATDASAVLGAQMPVRTIYNAVDLDRFSPGPGDGPMLDRQAGLPEAPAGTIRIGLVATYARWKGHEVFIDAVARVPVTPGRTTRFYIVGGPIYRSAGSQFAESELRALVHARGLEDRLGFVPHQSDPASVFRALDIVVHASIRPEPFGRVIAEAMACGRALIAAPTGGAAELFENGVSALGAIPGDPNALAAAMTQLATDPELRQRLAAEGRARAVSRFDRRGLADAWTQVYETAAQPR